MISIVIVLCDIFLVISNYDRKFCGMYVTFCVDVYRSLYLGIFFYLFRKINE